MSSGIIAIAAALAIAVSAVGVAFAQGKTAVATMEAMARQPETSGNLRTAMILAMGLMEALAIYGLLIAFMLVSKI